jgi:hypothetical protein
MERLYMKSKVETTGILRYNIICVNDKIIEFVDLKGANLAELAKEIGVDINHNVKAKISMEVVLEQCLFCGRITAGTDLCEECNEIVCNDCAKNYKQMRLCPLCYNKKQEQESTSVS